MKLAKRHHHLTAMLAAIMVLALVGCSKGYRLHRSGGVETLYHYDENGTKQIVYVVEKDGTLRIHNQQDPLIKRFYADHQIDTIDQGNRDLNRKKSEDSHPRKIAAKLIRIGRVKAAKKRDASDPIFITLHDPEVGPLMQQFTRGTEQTRQRFKKLVTDAFSQDKIINLCPEKGDVEVFFKSYFMETSAVSVNTRKVVTVNAFYFEAHVRSNYLPEDDYIIKELGHWMDSREVITRTAQRVGNVIKEKIGPNIPKKRTKFLPSPSQGV